MENHTFTELLEKYNNDGLKVLRLFEEKLEEEATPEEFEKELEAQKDKASGKVRNKNISKGAVQAVEVQKEEEQLDEYEVHKVTISGKTYYKDDEGNLTPANSKGGAGIKAYNKRKYSYKTTFHPQPPPQPKKVTEDLETIVERELSDTEKEDKEDMVGTLKKKTNYFKDKYGPRWKEVMYATATRIAKSK